MSEASTAAPETSTDLTPAEILEKGAAELVGELLELRANHGSAAQMSSAAAHRALDIVIEIVTRAYEGRRSAPAADPPAADPVVPT